MMTSNKLLSIPVAASSIPTFAQTQTTAMCAELAEAAKWPKERDAIQAAHEVMTKQAPRGINHLRNHLRRAG